MKTNFEIKALKDLCEDFRKDIVDGPFGSDLKRADYRSEGIPVLKIQNIKPFKIELKNIDYVQELKYLQLKRHSYSNGDIIMTKLGDPLGASAIVEEMHDGLIVADLVRIRAKKINAKYLCYHLNSPNTSSFINSQQKGTTRPRVRLENVRELPIYSPPMPTQQRIVSILDETFTGIEKAKENAQKNLQNARDLFESYLHSLFNAKWDEDKLVKLSELATDITDGDHLPPPKSPNGIPFITISDINKDTNKIDFTNTFKVPLEYFNNLKKNRKPRKGDLLYTVTGSYGIPVTVEDDIEFCFQRHIGLIRPNIHTETRFLYYLVLSPRFIKQANDNATGTAQKTVSLKVLRNIMVPKISISDQQSIIDKLDGLSNETKKLEATYQKKLANLEELKKSVLQKAFEGELTRVQG